MHHMKRKIIQMTRGVKKSHHIMKSYRNYTKVNMSTDGKQNNITNVKLYLGAPKNDLELFLIFNGLTKKNLLLLIICTYNRIKLCTIAVN